MDTTPKTAKGTWLRENLPRLKQSACSFTSPYTWDYNCVGFAIGDRRWWQHNDEISFYWPDGLPRDGWVKTYIKAIETQGFERCPDGRPEEGYRKLAVFHKGGRFTHVAFQATGDVWKSKLGEMEDIEHPLRQLEGGSYGRIYQYMRRRLDHEGELARI